MATPGDHPASIGVPDDFDFESHGITRRPDGLGGRWTSRRREGDKAQAKGQAY